MEFNIQFQNHFQLRKGARPYRKILFNLKEYGAIGVTMSEIGRITARSYLPSQVAAQPELTSISAFSGEENRYVQFSSLDGGIQFILKESFPESDLEAFSKMIDGLRKGTLHHIYKARHGEIFKKDDAVASTIFKHTLFLDIEHEISLIEEAFTSILKDISPAPQEKPAQEAKTLFEKEESPAAPEKVTKRHMLFCKDAGVFHNLTTGMLYTLIEADKTFYSILDDFGVKREFKKDRFIDVEVEG